MDSSEERNSSQLNVGVIVFSTFCLLSMLAGLSKGMPIIYLLESALWAGLTWYWKKKRIVSLRANRALLIGGLLVAAFEGYSVGRRASGVSLVHVSTGANSASSADLPDSSEQLGSHAAKMARDLEEAQSYLHASTKLCGYQLDSRGASAWTNLRHFIDEAQTAPFAPSSASKIDEGLFLSILDLTTAENDCNSAADKHSDEAALALWARLVFTETNLLSDGSELNSIETKMFAHREGIQSGQAQDDLGLRPLDVSPSR